MANQQISLFGSNEKSLTCGEKCNQNGHGIEIIYYDINNIPWVVLVGTA